MNEHYHKWYTQYLSREFEMLVFGHSGYPVIIFPTSKGRFYEAKDFGLIESIKHHIESGHVKVYCPDGIDGDSWYNYSIHPADRVKTHMAYERCIIHDVLGFAKYETGVDKVGVAGCSFGGYHALNFGLRNPDKVGYIFSMSGAFDIKQFIMGYYDENCYFNNPSDYLPNLNDKWFLDQMKSMGIVLGTGEGDMCFQENVEMSKLLGHKHIDHWFDNRLGADHHWYWWKQMFPDYLSQIK